MQIAVNSFGRDAGDPDLAAWLVAGPGALPVSEAHRVCRGKAGFRPVPAGGWNEP